MREKLQVMPREIYVDWGRDYTTIWTNTREVFTLNERDIISVAEQIRNLVSYILVNEKTGEKVQLQNIKVSIDIVSYGRFLKDRLEELGIQCEDITSGAWLKRMCGNQDIIYVDDYDYNFKKKINEFRGI